MNAFRMGGLKQKTSNDIGACLQKGSAEHGGYAREFTSIWITENNTVPLPEEDRLLGQILCPYNLNKSYLKVCRNRGSHGVDGLSVGSLRDYLKQHGSDLIKSIRNGTYRPNPVRRVDIPKDAHSKRPLGIPTVVNREKTSVVYFNRIKFLCYSFYKSKGDVRFRIHPKSIAKLKAKLRELTSRSRLGK